MTFILNGPHLAVGSGEESRALGDAGPSGSLLTHTQTLDNDELDEPPVTYSNIQDSPSTKCRRLTKASQSPHRWRFQVFVPLFC